jgi:hypothetical protein
MNTYLCLDHGVKSLDHSARSIGCVSFNSLCTRQIADKGNWLEEEPVAPEVNQ